MWGHQAMEEPQMCPQMGGGLKSCGVPKWGVGPKKGGVPKCREGSANLGVS